MHPPDNQVVNEFVEKMRVVQEEAKAALAKAKLNMAHYYDCGCTPALKYQPGDHVYFDTLDITMHGLQTLYAPFRQSSVNKFVEKMRVVQEEAKAALAKAKDDMACYYDCSHTPALQYQLSNHVYLDPSDITITWPLHKL